MRMENEMKDKFNLERFLEGQRFGYESALGEIKEGYKTGHWIWYVFPQIRGLGHSPNSQYYGLTGKEEARAFLEHPVLGHRLREISGALLAIEGKSAEEILSPLDAMKVRSCMTLFDAICPNDIFRRVLLKFYGGKTDCRTLEMI